MPHIVRYRVLLLLAVVGAFGLARSGTAQILPSFGGDRAGTSGFQFLKIPVDPRGAALGESAVSNSSDANALFWNPAMASLADGPTIALSAARYFADVRLQYAAVTYPFGGSGMTVGLNVLSMNSGSMNVTTEFEPFGTGETFELIDLSAGLTIAQSLTDLFSYGVTAKYVRESVAGVSATAALFDLGVFYKVGTTGARMGVAVRNFGPDATVGGEISRTTIGTDPVVVESDFESITPPTTFLLGATYDILPAGSTNNLRVTAQLNNPNDNAENWNVGLEYVWSSSLMLRTGYRFGLEERVVPSLGIGLATNRLVGNLRIDYSFNTLTRLGAVHRVGLNIGL